MGNPFKFGGHVTGEDFVDREREISELVRDVGNGMNVLLYSQRRMGKSSLMSEVVRRHRDEFIFVYVDLYGVTTKTRMAELILSSLVNAAYGSLEKVAAGFKDLLKGSRFRITVNEKGEPGIEFSVGEPTTPEVQDVLDLSEKVAVKKGRRVVVMLDEFQEVSLLDGVALLKAMRARIQTHKHVSYVFAGSKRHLLLSMFEEREGAFYKSARPMHLGPMPEADVVEFLVERFHEGGGRLGTETAEAVFAAAEGNPYYIQQIAYELYNVSTRPRWPEDFDAALSTSLAHQEPAFSSVWDSVKSGIQRRYLLAAASEPGAPYSASFIERHRLKSASHVQKVVGQLDSRGITDDGQVTDPLFRLWLRGLA